MSKIILIIIAIIIVVAIIWGVYYLASNQTAAPTTTSLENQTTMENTNQAANLKIETLKEGTGEGAKNGNTVTVNYLGTLQDGTKFDSSYDRKQPFSFTLGNKGPGGVIEGWNLGVVGMKVGEKRKLTIPAALGYGDNVVGKIPANSTLIFEIELVAINH